MNASLALARVEDAYGSVEDFAYTLLTDKAKAPALDEMLPITKRAEIAGLPLPVFARVLGSPEFRALLRADMVNKEYGLLAEQSHINAVSKVAQNHPRTVMSNKGTIGEVDQAPMDMIAAGRYLNELRGTPVESKASGVGGGITINIHNALNEEADVTITLEADAGVHQPRGAGELPPPGVLGRRAQPAPRAALEPAGDGGGLGALYGPGAEEADEAHALARRAQGERVGAEPDEEPGESGSASGTHSRRRIPWPGRGRPQPRRSER